jgi:hypothetical protein
MRYSGWAGAGLAVMLSLLVAPAAQASSPDVAGPIQAGLSITPSATVVGSTVTVTATATNTTGSAAAVSLGVENKASLRTSSVSGSAGCTPRNLTRLVYCGVQSLAPGATAHITVTLVPPVAGRFDFQSYARITYTTDDTDAYGTLTVS